MALAAAGIGKLVLVDGDRMPGARWFPGAYLNFTENRPHHGHPPAPRRRSPGRRH